MTTENNQVVTEFNHDSYENLTRNLSKILNFTGGAETTRNLNLYTEGGVKYIDADALFATDEQPAFESKPGVPFGKYNIELPNELMGIDSQRYNDTYNSDIALFTERAP